MKYKRQFIKPIAQGYFIKKVYLKILQTFTENSGILLSIKSQIGGIQICYKKETPAQVFRCDFYGIF